MNVTFELAKELKELGYNVPCDLAYYHGYINSDPLIWIYADEPQFALAPTLSEVCEWLRGKGLHVNIDPTLDWSRWFITIHDKEQKMWSKRGSADDHDTALIAGIKHAIDHLKNRNDGK